MTTKYLYNATGNLEDANALSTSSSSQVNATYSDGDAVVINAGNVLTITADHTSDTTGMAGLTITGIASGTPAMLTFAATGTCVLKMASNTTISGTNVAVRGRIMMGGGTWGSPSALAFTTKHGIVMGGTTTPAKIDATYLDIQAYCLWPTVQSARTYNQIPTATGIAANIVTLGSTPASPAWANGTVVRCTSSGTYPSGLRPNTDYWITAYSAGTFELQQYSGTPTLSLGNYFTVSAANATVGAIYSNNGRTFVVTATIAGATTLQVQNVSGAPLSSGTLTKISGTGDATITFSAFSTTASWTGTLQFYDGCASGATVLNVLDDVTGDSSWSTTDNWNWACFVDETEASANRTDRTKITGISAFSGTGTITLANGLSAAARAGSRIWLASRNVQLQCPAGTAASTAIVDWTTSTFTGSVLQCFVGNTTIAGNSATYYGYGTNGGGTGGVGHTLKIAAFGNSSASTPALVTTPPPLRLPETSYGINGGTGHNATSATFVGNADGINSRHWSQRHLRYVRRKQHGINAGTGHNATSATFAGNINGISGGTGHNATSATFAGNIYGINGGTGHNATSATFVGNTNGINAGTGHNATSAAFAGNTYGISGGTGHNATSATFVGNTYGISVGDTYLGNASFASNTQDIVGPSTCRGYGATLGSSTQVSAI